jgi:Type II secretion system (T2SS), protein E, N-terminal domain
MSAPPSSAAPDAVTAEALSGWPIERSLAVGASVVDLLDEPGLPAEIEGRQGRQVATRLLSLQHDEQAALIRIPPKWQWMSMPLSRVTCIRMRSRTAPQHVDPCSFTLSMRHGVSLHGEALALAEHPLGLFLVQAIADGEGWQRVFYPRGGWSSLVLGHGTPAITRPCDTPDALRLSLQAALTPAPRLGGVMAGLQQRRGQRQWLHSRASELWADVPRVDVLSYPVEVTALRHLGFERARRLEALPLGALDGAQVVVVDDPGKRDTLRELGFLFGSRVTAVLPARHSTAYLVQEVYERHGLAPTRWFD